MRTGFQGMKVLCEGDKKARWGDFPRVKATGRCFSCPPHMRALRSKGLSGLPAQACLASPASHSHPHCLPLRLLELGYPGLGSLLPPAGRGRVGSRAACCWVGSREQLAFLRAITNQPEQRLPEKAHGLFSTQTNILGASCPQHTYAIPVHSLSWHWGEAAGQGAVSLVARRPGPTTLCVALDRPPNLSGLACPTASMIGAKMLLV